ncbi:MAG: nucleotidyltransferase family protein [Clostridia bacterium]|nr:nucleotidyltransferase family protein [Clostridia bacterium]
MKITGVICEYNPFHNGHKYLLDSLRGRGGELIMCVMSGSFVQRGESAVADKFTRAACAVAAGADIVFELPFPYCMASAEYFAAAGVHILSELGADTLGFGSESADEKGLRAAAEVILGERFSDEYRRLCRAGKGSAAAYFEAYENITGERMACGSNDILALAYIKEILRRGGAMKTDIIQRRGAAYGSENVEQGELPSATALRKNMLLSGIDDLQGYVPEETVSYIKQAAVNDMSGSHIKNIGRDIITYLRMSDVKTFEGIADVGDGLAERICAAASRATDLDQLLSEATTANYTDARVRRGIINMLVGVRREDLRSRPAYVQLLAANERGRKYLAERRRDEDLLRIVTKPADARTVAGGTRQYELTCRAEALWCMTLPRPLPADTLTKMKPIFI